MVLIFLVNMLGFVPLKDKKGVSIANAFQKILDDSIENQTKCALTKEVNFTINHLKNG